MGFDVMAVMMSEIAETVEFIRLSDEKKSIENSEKKRDF